MRRLEGRVAVVTGAASGIGRATAIRLAAEGATAFVTDIQDDAGQEVSEEIRESGGSASFDHHDVASEADWARVVDRVLTDAGRLDILVNNAGFGDLAAIEETTLEDYESTIAVDQTGVYLEETAAAIAFLVTDDASFVTGAELYVDGGFISR